MKSSETQHILDTDRDSEATSRATIIVVSWNNYVTLISCMWYKVNVLLLLYSRLSPEMFSLL